MAIIENIGKAANDSMQGLFSTKYAGPTMVELTKDFEDNNGSVDGYFPSYQMADSGKTFQCFDGRLQKPEQPYKTKNK